MNQRDNRNVPCVELRNLTKRFEAVVAVDHVDLSIEKGELFSLLGPSGCGKTTTLRLIGGLETQDEGDVLINGEIVNDVPAFKRDSSIVFQELALFPHLSVEENIRFGLERRDVPDPEANRRVARMLELVKLTGMEHRRPDQLSGGQQQRVALARSLVLNPEILLLDEPLSSLDRKLRKEMQVELKQIQREVGTTFLYVTHDQSVALSLSDRMAVMRSGRLIQVGPPEELYEHPETEFVANFMGAMNIFSGQAVRGENETLTLRTEDGLEIVGPSSSGLEPGEVRGASVRPKALRIGSGDTGLEADNRLAATVVDSIYQGGYSEVTLRIENGQTLVAFAETTDDYGEGDEVQLGWARADTNFLR